MVKINYVLVAGNIPPNADTTATSFDYKDENSESETTLKTHQYPPPAATFSDADYEFVERENYNALPAAAVSELLSLPIRRVIIAHTVTPTCTNNVRH